MAKKILAHAAIVLAGMLIVLLVIDNVNSAMQFIDNGITKWLIGILCVLSVYHAALRLRRPKRTGNRKT
ncbi:MAG: hypothetical protein ACOYI8_07000 [Christensenellales bacterium]|jgi:fumarate reductase subunit D